MEGMIAKLVNLDTDIDTQKPNNDSVTKKIIDRVKFRVRRKNKRDVNACLPALHAFGCNDLPRTLDGASRAYDRRIVVLETTLFQPSGLYDLYFDQWVWERVPAGIVQFAIGGLFDLAKNRGHYHVPASSAEQVTKKQDQGDVIGQFLKAISEGEVVDKNTTF